MDWENFEKPYKKYTMNLSGMDSWITGKIRDLAENVSLRIDAQLLREIDPIKRHRLAIQYLPSELGPKTELDLANALDDSGVWWSVVEGLSEKYILLKFAEYTHRTAIFDYIPKFSAFISYEKAILPCDNLKEDVTSSRVYGEILYFEYIPRLEKFKLCPNLVEYPCSMQEITPDLIDILISKDYDLAQKLWMRGYFDLIENDWTRNYIFQELRRVYYKHNQFI